MGVFETSNCAWIRKISFLQQLGCDVRSRREDKAVFRWLWEKEGGSSDGDKVARNRVQIASPAGAHLLGLETYFIILYIPSTATF